MPAWMKWTISLLVAAALIALGWRIMPILVTLHVLVCFVLIIVFMATSLTLSIKRTPGQGTGSILEQTSNPAPSSSKVPVQAPASTPITLPTQTPASNAPTGVPANGAPPSSQTQTPVAPAQSTPAPASKKP